jgi:hypothetical protein
VSRAGVLQGAQFTPASTGVSKIEGNDTRRRAPCVYSTPACTGYIPPVCQLARRRVAGACTSKRAGVLKVCTSRRRVQVTAGVLQLTSMSVVVHLCVVVHLV